MSLLPRPCRKTLSLFSLLFLSLVSISHAAQWRPIGPEGASIQAVAYGAGGMVYAVTAQGTVVASSDGAASWSSRGKLPAFYGKLAADPARPGILYARTFNGLSKSVDGGATWSGSLAAGILWTFGIAPSSPDVLYAAQDQKVLKSTDGGASWTATSFAGPASVLTVDPADSNVVYAGGAGGLFRSDDGGSAWRELPVGTDVKDLAIDPRQPAILYVLRLLKGVFKSTDRGATWSLVWKGPGDYPFLEILTIDPAAGDLYAIERSSGLYRSTDGGASWTQTLPIYRLQAVAVDGQSSGRVYAATRSGGVYRSDDRGGTWAAANHGLRELAFIAVAADPHTPGALFAIASPDPTASLAFSPHILLRSTDGGVTWSSPFGDPDDSPFSNAIVADPSRPGAWYLATYGVLKTRDGGRAWEISNQGLRQLDFIYTLAAAPSSPDTLYAIGWDTFPLCNSSDCPRIVIYRSVDGGAQWRRARVPGLEHGNVLSSLAVDAVNPAIVYAGGPHVFKSTDGGMSWRPTAGSLRGSITSLAADPFTSGTLYASVYVPRGRRVYKSTDGGATWKPASGGLSVDVGVGRIIADPRAPGTLYAATGRGVYVTKNGGALWTPLNEGWSEAAVWSLALDPLRSGVLYAGRADGLFEYSSAPAAAR